MAESRRLGGVAWRSGPWLALVAVGLLVLVVRQVEDPEPILCGRDVTPGSDTLVMLSASWCGYCRRARDYLQTQAIAHCEYDIDDGAEGRRLFDTLPQRVVPTIRIHDDVLVGFNRAEIEQTLMAHGLMTLPE
ncbi:MAG: glutaredoxin family protein [Gammaproteobacteria bacterium]